MNAAEKIRLFLDVKKKVAFFKGEKNRFYCKKAFGFSPL